MTDSWTTYRLPPDLTSIYTLLRLINGSCKACWHISEVTVFPRVLSTVTYSLRIVQLGATSTPLKSLCCQCIVGPICFFYIFEKMRLRPVYAYTYHIARQWRRQQCTPGAGCAPNMSTRSHVISAAWKLRMWFSTRLFTTMKRHLQRCCPIIMPNIRQLLLILATLPVTTPETERLFSKSKVERMYRDVCTCAHDWRQIGGTRHD